MYNFDNITGESTGNIMDSSQYANNGSGYGGITWTGNGKRNGAYNFNGTNSYIASINNVALNKQASISFRTIHQNVASFNSKIIAELSSNYNSNNAFYAGFNDSAGNL